MEARSGRLPILQGLRRRPNRRSELPEAGAYRSHEIDYEVSGDIKRILRLLGYRSASLRTDRFSQTTAGLNHVLQSWDDFLPPASL